MNFFDYRNNLDDEVYSQFEVSKMILRDHLAADRTILSNQNTFLAYVRTALTLFVAGVTFIRFFDTPITVIIGWIFIPTGISTFLVGLIRYNIHRVTLRRLKRYKKNRP